MAYFEGGLKGGIGGVVGGAAAGSILFGPVGAMAGGALGVLSFLGGLFSKSPEEERQERKRANINAIMAYNDRAIAQGSKIIGDRMMRSTALARQTGGARAAVMGRGNQVEDFAVPGEQRALTSGSESMDNFVTGVNRETGRMLADVESGFADRPIEPGFSDSLLALGTQAGMIKQNLDAFNATEPITDERILNPEPVKPMKPAPMPAPRPITSVFPDKLVPDKQMFTGNNIASPIPLQRTNYNLPEYDRTVDRYLNVLKSNPTSTTFKDY